VSRDLRPLFDPGSVAVLGASSDPHKWGYWLARGALKGSHRRHVYLVNRGGGEILGRQAFHSLDDLPSPVELVVVAVPASAFEEAVDASLAAGAQAIVGISAGLGETGGEGARHERAAVERVRAAGAVLLGPNCLGLLDAEADLDIGWNELPRGPVGLISQSGNLALELGLLLEDHGLGYSRFASLGNQADLEAAELVEAFAGHRSTRVIMLYCEDFRDGRAFARAAEAAGRAGKPVVLLAVGRSESSARAARSHTGALVSDTLAVDAACRAAGILRASTPRELVDLAQALAKGVRPRGRRVAVVGDGGGHGVIAADIVETAGLQVPPLSDHLAARLGESLPPRAATRNPVDTAGGEQDFWAYERIVRLVLDSGEVDSVLLTGYFGGYGQDEALREAELEVARAIPRASIDTERPLVVHTMYAGSPAAVALRAGGVPVYREVEAAARVLGTLARHEEQPARGVPELPATAMPSVVRADYLGARALLAEAGIRFAPAQPAVTLAEAKKAAAELGYPVVLKALGLLHKSDAGGIALALENEEALEFAFSEMATRLRAEGYVVERMAKLGGGLELIVGCRRDRRFGPIALVGLGGVHAELFEDVAVALAPVDESEAEELLRSVRGAPLLLGARGRPPLDVRTAARAVADLSALAAAHPELAEIEVNPLLVSPHGALGLDARIVLAGPHNPDP
jgi:acyl-CoA synthetase (NDP forming)